MTPDEFDLILKYRFEQSIKVLGTKAKEYSTDVDRLHNFKRAGASLGISPERACLGMLVKHYVSILDLVDNVYVKPIPTEVIDEKIGDVINYFILLEALMRERSNISVPESFIAETKKNVKKTKPTIEYKDNQ